MHGGEGGGAPNKVSYGRLSQEVQALTLYRPFLTETAPLSYTFHRKWHRFHIPTSYMKVLREILKGPFEHWAEPPGTVHMGSAPRGVLQLPHPLAVKPRKHARKKPLVPWVEPSSNNWKINRLCAQHNSE